MARDLNRLRDFFSDSSPSKLALFFRILPGDGTTVQTTKVGLKRRGCAPGWMEVTKDDMEIVSALRATLADKVGKERYELWFGTGTWFRLDPRALTIGVPNRFFRDWIRSNFRRHIESACLEALGSCPTLKFSVDDPAAEQGPQPSAAAKADPPAAGQPTTRPARPRPAPLGRDPAAPADGQPAPNGNSYCVARRKFSALSSYVTGQSNRLAFVSAEMVAQRPGQITPLLIHGPTGVGKTHLLEGIWTAAQLRRTAARLPSTCRPSNSPASSSRPSAAAACPTSAASTAAWPC